MLSVGDGLAWPSDPAPESWLCWINILILVPPPPKPCGQGLIPHHLFWWAWGWYHYRSSFPRRHELRGPEGSETFDPCPDPYQKETPTQLRKENGLPWSQVWVLFWLLTLGELRQHKD